MFMFFVGFFNFLMCRCVLGGEEYNYVIILWFISKKLHNYIKFTDLFFLDLV